MIYEFHYPRYKVRQKKRLISHDVFLQYRAMPTDTKDEEREAKKYLKSHTLGMEWFTDKSPLYESIFTGGMTIGGLYIEVEARETEENNIITEDEEVF